MISAAMARESKRDVVVSQLEKEIVRLQVQRNSDVAIQTTSREEPITLPVSDMIIN